MLQEVEKDVKARTKGEMGAAKTLCTPFVQPELPEGTSDILYYCETAAKFLEFEGDGTAKVTTYNKSLSSCILNFMSSHLTKLHVPITGTLCFASGKPAKKWTYWGRSY